MRQLFPVLVLAGVLAASGAVAQINPEPVPQGPPSSAPSSATAAKPVAPDSEIVCRYEQETGTRFMSRICHTKRQWKQRERDAYDLLDRLDSGKDQTIFQ
jgi:hypothetical protein